MRQLLRRMDGGDEDAKAPRQQLDFIFPLEFAAIETACTPK